LIDSADAALLVAKQTGRNRIITASALEEGDLAEACGGPLQRVLVRDIMVPAMARLSPEETVAQAAQRLMELNLDSLPVVAATGAVTGFVTEQDLLTALLQPAGARQPIANCSQLSVAVFEETVSAKEIATFFTRTAVQRVIVVRQGFPVGLVSRRTLMRWLLNSSLDRLAATGPVARRAAAAPGELQESIRDLAAAISRLSKMDTTGCEEQLNSSLVGEATRIQETVENLLLNCRLHPVDSRSHDLARGALSLG
jgi:CBS domain-containing protein